MRNAKIAGISIALAASMAAVVIGVAPSDARAHRPVARKAAGESLRVLPPEKPVKLRYYGGPKSPMYPG